MVNFSLFSERAQEIIAQLGAEQRGTTAEEERARLLAEEAKRPSRSVKLKSAKLEEERKALQTLQKNHPKVFADVQKGIKQIEVDTNNIGKSFVVELTERLAFNKDNGSKAVTQQIEDGMNRITFGQGSTSSLFTGATFAIVDKFLKEVFGNVRGVEFNPETQALIDAQKKIIKELQPALESAQAAFKKLIPSNNVKQSKSQQIARQREQIKISSKLAEIRNKITKAELRIKALQEENTQLVKITEAFRRQTDELKEFVSRARLSQIEKIELEEAIQRGSALIGESLNRQIVLEKGLLQDLQLSLRDAAIKLQQPALEQLEASETFLTGKPSSVFQESSKEISDGLLSLEGIFGEPTQNIGAEIANGIKASADLTEEELTEQFVKTFRAQQKALISLGETP